MSGEGVLDRRRTGVLLHVTSLPHYPGCGVLGGPAHHCVDLLAEAGISVWQMLPVGPTHADDSPYHGLSVQAGNPSLIDLESLHRRGWLEEAVPADREVPAAHRRQALRDVRAWFERHGDDDARAAYRGFAETERAWLDDYALFSAIREEEDSRVWWRWPAPLRDREPGALNRARERLSVQIEQHRFEQFLFHTQWTALRDHAAARGVRLFGDIPIFVAHDSADVWAHRGHFLLDDRGLPRWVAGVPPDYFSQEGQRWGNPLYDWQRMVAEGFVWWEMRFVTQLRLFDLLRIDHFRGFQACWQIPASSTTARDGHWEEVPGAALFERLQQRLGRLPLVAEDLGFITPEVHALRQRFGLPGMRVLQFAFDGGADNPYLPHNHTPDSVVYTGTHDNDTTLGWFEKLPNEVQARVMRYLGRPGESMPRPLIRAALASVARLAVIPMQDLLALDSRHRMNVPGTTGGNWRWRMTPRQLEEFDLSWVRDCLGEYGR